jgi:hypothetical protein
LSRQNTLDELDAHLSGQQRMLEVGRVVDPGGQHHHGRVGLVGGRGVAQRPQQVRGVVVDGAHPVTGEQVRENPRHGAPVLHDVRHARGRAQVVLENPPGAFLVADQVDAGDMDAHAVGRDDAHGLAVKVLARRDQPAWDDAVVQNLLVAVDVVEIQLESFDALDDAALQPGPFGRRDHPRHHVQWKWPLLTGQGESDPLVDERAGQRLGAGFEVRGVRRRKLGVDALVRATHVALGIEHLVEGQRVGVRRQVVSAEDSLETRQRPPRIAGTPPRFVQLVRKTHLSDAASN